MPSLSTNQRSVILPFIDKRFNQSVSHHAVFVLLTTDIQEGEKELASAKKMKTVNSAEKKQAGNAREKTKKKEEHSCKTGHLSMLTENY